MTRERPLVDAGAQAASPRHERPGPLRWTWYALGGRLPGRFSAWVLHDTTTRTWALRHLSRAGVQMALPIALVLTLVPGPFWIRGMSALAGVLLGLIFSSAYITETTENRVVRAGFPPGTAQATRERAGRVLEQRASQRRREAATHRAARYQARRGR
jgi:hypothetical protein